MGEDEIESLSMEMASLTSVGPETTESIFAELAALANAGEAGTSGGIEFARGVIERALGPERAAELLGRLVRAHRDAARSSSCSACPPERTAALLRSESPQTIALILASLHTSSPRRCSRACPSASSRTSRCGSRAWARPARRWSSRSRR